MKICFLCPDLGISIDGRKGASSHIRGFTSALKRLGHDIAIAATVPIKEALDIPHYVIPQPECIEGFLEQEDPRTFRALRHVLYNCAIDASLKTIIQKEKPDLIYERYSPFSAAGGICARRHSIPHMLEVNAPLSEQGRRYRKLAMQDASEFLEKTAFNQAGLLITLTKELKEWLVQIGIPEEKVKIRPCAVDEKLFKPEGESYKARFKEKIVLGFVGSLKPWHDIGLLAEVFRRLARNPCYHLLVVGDGPMRQTVKALSEQLPGRVTCTGAVEQSEVPKYIRAMDIALAPYPEMDLFYFSPLKVYEYMAMGKAVVATGIGQLKELISHNKNGCLVPRGDAEEWVRTIEALSEDPPAIKRLGSAALEEVYEKHTWDKRMQTFTKIVEEFLNESQMAFSI